MVDFVTIRANGSGGEEEGNSSSGRVKMVAVVTITALAAVTMMFLVAMVMMTAVLVTVEEVTKSW